MRYREATNHFHSEDDMSNQFTGTGNVGTAPTLRQVQAADGRREIAEMRVYFDRRVPKGNGFEDKGGFWLTVSVWGSRAARVAEIIQKGARIQVTGSLRQESWTDKESGAERSELRLTAESFTLDPLCIDSVAYKKRSGNDGGNARGYGDATGGNDAFDGAENPF